METTFFRMDDVGASTKQFEVYSRLPFGNILWLKYARPFRAWGPYRELTADEWERILTLLRSYDARLTVGITASWVEQDNSLTPFPQKFPDEAEAISHGVKEGLLEIASHGLTHCVVGQHRPRLLSSNRKWHREFWPWVPTAVHQDHLRQSRDILESFFGVKLVTFIPPGNVWTADTERLASALGFLFLASNEQKAPTGKSSNGMTYVGDDHGVVFHDRELVLDGLSWLEQRLKLARDRGQQVVKVAEYLRDHGK